MRIILTLLILTSLTTFAQENKDVLDYKTMMLSYVRNPDSNDTLCRTEIERAKNDLGNGKIVLTQQAGFIFGDLRYENELRRLCIENGFVFEFDMLGCVVFEGQTQGCYGYFMDNFIIEKFGKNFKENLHHKADSLFLVKANEQNKVVEYWDCDERPRLPNEKKRTTDYLPSIKVKNLEIIKDESEYGGWPFFDLGFIVEKDSTISNFHIRYWVAHLETNEKFKEILFELAVSHMKTEYPKWIPGKVIRIPVRTDNNVRIHFVKE